MATKKPSIVAGKTAEEILLPPTRLWSYGGQDYEIRPMTDAQLMTVADALSGVVAAIQKSGLFEGQTNGLLGAVPGIARALIPNATKLISASLGVPEDQVSQRIPLAARLDCLKVILDAEDIPTILKNVSALLTLLPKTVQQPDSQETETAMETLQQKVTAAITEAV